MAHLNNDNPEIILLILGLLRLLTWGANIESQNVIFEEISDRNSVFCRKVYELLEEVISTLSETWAKLVLVWSMYQYFPNKIHLLANHWTGIY